MKIVLSLLLSLASGTAAYADNYKVIGLNGSDLVFVWQSKQAHDEGLSLINSGVHKTNPEMVMRLLACLVPSGTTAIVTDMGFATHDILITEGDDAGCRGNIAMESLKRN